MHLQENVGDVDAAVFGRVGGQPALCFLKLALAADAVPPARLVPGDSDVNEALVEVALLGLGGAPRRLQLLVGREELSAMDQLQAAAKRL